MAAVLVLYLRGDTINTMILAGLVIAVGVVVDDAIIDVENIWRRLRERARRGADGSPPRIILDASLEVRSAIIYATLINVVAVVPVFFLESVTGSFFEPLAFSYALAVLVSMVVALTVTPALSPDPAAHGRRASAATPRSCAWLKRGYARAAGARPAPAAPGLRRGRSPRRSPACVVGARARREPLPGVQGARLPDALDHHARHVAPRGAADRDPGQPRAARRSRACATSARTSARRSWPRRSRASNFGENWVSVDRDADYDKTLAAIEEVVDGYPGLYRDVQTYLRERIDEVLAGAARADRGAHLRPGPRRRCATSGRRGCAGRSRDIDGLDDLHTELHGRRAADRGPREPRRGAALRPQAGRRPPRGRAC